MTVDNVNSNFSFWRNELNIDVSPPPHVFYTNLSI